MQKRSDDDFAEKKTLSCPRCGQRLILPWWIITFSFYLKTKTDIQSVSDSYIWTPVHKLNHLIWSFWGDFSFSNFWLAAYPSFTHLSKPNVPQSQGQKWNIAVSPVAKSHWAFKPNSAALCCLLCQNKYSSWMQVTSWIVFEHHICGC